MDVEINANGELTNKEKIDFLLKQNEELIREKANLIKENETLKLNKNFLEESLFKSKIFANLVSQCQEILRYSNSLKAKLSAANKKINELEQLRNNEIEEFEKKIQNEKEKLQNEIDDLKLKLEKRKVEFNFSNYFDVGVHTKPLIESLESATKNLETLAKENQLLQNLMKDFKVKHDEEMTKRILVEDNTKHLEIELIALKNQLPNAMNYDQMTFRKYKDIISEIGFMIPHSNPLRKKFDELMNYLKTREQKLEYVESKLKASNHNINVYKKQIEELLNEVDVTSKSYEEILHKNKKLLSQIKDSEDTFDKMVKEKFSEKIAFEQEKNSFLIKIKADQELIQQQNYLLDIYRKKENEINEMKNLQEDQFLTVKSALDESKLQREELIKRREELQEELKQMKEKINTFEIVSSKKMEECYIAQQSLKEKQLFIEKKIEQKNRSKKDIDIDFYELELNTYKKMAYCSVCVKNYKKVILSRCNHLFCKDCIENCLSVRNRGCPICKMRFGQEDVKEIYLT